MQLTMSTGGEKKFVIKHVYTDVRAMKADEWLFGKPEKHFNVTWKPAFFNINDGFYLRLQSELDGSHVEWTIDTTISAKLKTTSEKEEVVVRNCKYSNKSSWCAHFIENKPLINYTVDGSLSVEFLVTINKMTGFPESLRSFDESAKELSDVVLVVKDQKFYVYKMYLATHSSYFKALLLGNFDESKQSEVELKDVDPYNFQSFLEVLYGEPVIHDDSIEGILELADMYDAKTAIRQCEEFFIHKSKQDMKVKFKAAAKYKMEKLLDKCISEIKTIADIEKVKPEDFTDFDPKIAGKLLSLAIDIYKKK